VDLSTDRELRVLELVAFGRTTKEIAAELGLSEATISFHVSSCLRKLGARSRAEAVANAIRTGQIRK